MHSARATIPSSGWIATRLVSLQATARSLMHVFLRSVLFHCTISKSIPNMKLPCIIRHSVIYNCANYDIYDISGVMP